MPIPEGVIPKADLEVELRRQIEILDAMFDDAGLLELRTRFPLHPAVLRRDRLTVFVPGRSRPIDEQLAIAGELGVMGIDRLLWMPDAVPGVDYWSFLPDAEAAKRVRRNLRNPEVFNETLAEVRTWSDLNRHGLDAQLLEEEGKPDISIRTDDGLWWVEVKYIHATTGDLGVRRALKKANKQIREASGAGSGVVYIYLDHDAPPRDETPKPDGVKQERAPGDEDPLPPPIIPRLETIETALRSGKYKSAAVVIACWYDQIYMVRPEKSVMTFLSRQPRLRRHPTPRSNPPFRDEELLPGGYLVTEIRASPHVPQSTAEIVGMLASLEVDAELPIVTELDETGYTRLSGGVIRPPRALEILARPDAFRVYASGEDRFLIATREFSEAARPFVAFAVAVVAQGVWRATGGFRVRLANKDEVRAFAQDPALSLATLLERYGVDTWAGKSSTRFLATTDLNLDIWQVWNDPVALLRELGVDRDPRDFAGHMTLTQPSVKGLVRAAWLFILDVDTYSNAER